MATTKKKPANPESAKEDPRFDVKAGETRVYRCTRSCYWEGKLWQGKDRFPPDKADSLADQVTFKGPTKIPWNFQWDSWEQIA